jgi:hypothetical protein
MKESPTIEEFKSLENTLEEKEKEIFSLNDQIQKLKDIQIKNDQLQNELDKIKDQLDNLNKEKIKL